ncbi:MAG: nitroreductase family protein [Fusobacteriota bacterium]
MKDLKEIFEARRSVNSFDTEKKIEKGLLKKIINLATLAPSCFNMQPWELIVIESEDKKKELYDKSCNQPKVLDAPVTLGIIGHTKGYTKKNPIWKVKKDLGRATDEDIENYVNMMKGLFPNREREVGFAVRNSSLLAMSIMYAAKYYGVDSHAMIGFDEDEFKKLFNIEEDKVVTMLMTLGYFDNKNELYPREKRFNYEEIATEY